MSKRRRTDEFEDGRAVDVPSTSLQPEIISLLAHMPENADVLAQTVAVKADQSHSFDAAQKLICDLRTTIDALTELFNQEVSFGRTRIACRNAMPVSV